MLNARACAGAGKAGGKGPSQPAAGAKGAPQPAAGGKGAPQPMATAKPAEPAQPAQPEINLGRFTAEKEDIVITVFKKFQTAYRGLMDGLKARNPALFCHKRPRLCSTLPGG